VTVKVSLAQILGVSPQKTVKFLATGLGTEVKKGDILAVRKKILGKEIKVVSEVDGILQSLSSQTGELVILEKNKEKPIAKAAPDKSSGDKIFKGVFGFGQAQGEAVFLNEDLEFTKLKPDLAGKVVIAPSLGSTASLFKACALGIGAIVVGWVSKDTLEQIQENLMSERDFGFLVLQQGQDKKLLENLKKLAGKKIRVEGKKKILYF